jgi:hypothetical protein
MIESTKLPPARLEVRVVGRLYNSRVHPTARHVAGSEMIIPHDELIAVSERRVNRRSR